MNANSIKYTEGQVLGDNCIFIRDTDTKSKPRKALFKCQCGNEFETTINAVKKMHSTSCGCKRVNSNLKRCTTHGATKTKEFLVWQGIKSRIFNPNCAHYDCYGGRGIKMHESWVNDFPQFLKDVGYAPSPKHTIDRIDVNGHYEPGNVRYATVKEQQNNKRNNFLVAYKGETKTIAQWSDQIGISQPLLRRRIVKGWSLDDAFDPKKRINQFG